MPSKQQWQYFEFEPNIFDLWLFQKPINTILFLGLKILSISTIFFNLCRPLCVYARYICTNLIVYFVNKREDFLWKAPKWENEIYLKEMERPISLRLCKVYYPRSQGVIWPSFSSYANWPISMQIWFLFYRYQFRRGSARARDLRQMKIKRPALMHFDTVKIGIQTNQYQHHLGWVETWGKTLGTIMYFLLLCSWTLITHRPTLIVPPNHWAVTCSLLFFWRHTYMNTYERAK